MSNQLNKNNNKNEPNNKKYDIEVKIEKLLSQLMICSNDKNNVLLKRIDMLESELNTLRISYKGLEIILTKAVEKYNRHLILNRTKSYNSDIVIQD